MTEKKEQRKTDDLTMNDADKIILAQFLDKLDLTDMRKNTLFDVGVRLIDVHGMKGTDAVATIARILRRRR